MKKNWLIILLFSTIFFLCLFPPIDTDLGWHLRYGKHILETHTVWKTNEIGFFLTDYHWAHSYSLYQPITFLIFKHLGFWGLTIFGSLTLTLSLFLIYQATNRQKILLKIIGLLFVFLISLPVISLGYRSQLFTILGISFLFYFLLNDKKIPLVKFLILPPLFAIWVNFHGGFILGIIILLFYSFGKLIQKKYKEGLKKIAITNLCALATLVNPFGWRIYQEVYRHSWYPLNKLIAEWVPPNNIFIALIIIIFSGLSLVLFFQRKNREFYKKNAFLIFSWLFFTYLAFAARRNLAFFGISSFCLFFKIFPHPKKSALALSSLEKKLIIISLLGLTSWRLITFSNLRNDWQSICHLSKWTLPCQAVEFLKTKPQICGRIFNAYEWGGYLAWHLPESKIFVDGRMPAWPTPEGKSPYTIYLEIVQTQKGFNEKLLQHQADCLLIGRGTFLDLELREKDNYPWQLIWEDDIAAVYQREKDKI